MLVQVFCMFVDGKYLFRCRASSYWTVNTWVSLFYFKAFYLGTQTDLDPRYRSNRCALPTQIYATPAQRLESRWWQHYIYMLRKVIAWLLSTWVRSKSWLVHWRSPLPLWFFRVGPYLFLLSSQYQKYIIRSYHIMLRILYKPTLVLSRLKLALDYSNANCWHRLISSWNLPSI